MPWFLNFWFLKFCCPAEDKNKFMRTFHETAHKFEEIFYIPSSVVLKLCI
jgi:hypothetical protein